MNNWLSGLISQVLAGQVRTALAVGGGVLLANGADPETVGNLQNCLAEPVVGLGLWAVAGLWSAKAKTAVPPFTTKVQNQAPPAPQNHYPK